MCNSIVCEIFLTLTIYFLSLLIFRIYIVESKLVFYRYIFQQHIYIYIYIYVAYNFLLIIYICSYKWFINSFYLGCDCRWVTLSQKCSSKEDNYFPSSHKGLSFLIKEDSMTAFANFIHLLCLFTNFNHRSCSFEVMVMLEPLYNWYSMLNA